MQPIQSLVSAAVARVVRPAPLSPEKVLFAWRAAVGPAVARVTRVRLTGGGVLEVELDDGRFGDELVRSAPVVLIRMQDLLGAEAVSRVAVRRPEPRRPGRPRRTLAGVARRKKGDA